MPKNSGFTLIELLIVVTIISVLTAVGVASYSNFLKNGRDTKRLTDLRLIQSGLEKYRADRGFYPCGGTTVGGIEETCDSPFDPDRPIDPDDPDPIDLNNNTGIPSTKASYPAKYYITSMPKDPGGGLPYIYNTSPENCDNDVEGENIYCYRYCLYTKLENPPSLPVMNGCTTFGDYNYAITSPN